MSDENLNLVAEQLVGVSIFEFKDVAASTVTFG